MGQNLRWLLLLAVVIALFFWKILFTNQFSILLGWEAANQVYSWSTFAAGAVQRGISPIWDPYVFSGHTFIGEMQTGLFYPLKLFLYLWPLGAAGLFSARLLHEFFVLAHLIGACFMFFLAREIGLKSGFAAFVSTLCFTLGGFVGRVGWPNMLDSAIWTPLIFLCLLRALNSDNGRRRILYACCSGLSLGMAILAGSLHVAIMDAILVLSAAAFWAIRTPGGASLPPLTRFAAIRQSALVVAVIGTVSFAAGAIQLLPSMEYSALAIRWTGDWAGPANMRIPYQILSESARLLPQSIFAFLFGGADTGGSEFSPYMGVMPLLLTIVGVWRNWERPWVKYLAGLGVAAFIYCLGSYSLLHGVLYLLVPFLDMAREAGRFIYLANFAMALLAGFGVESLLANDARCRDALAHLTRVLKWTVIVVLLAAGVPLLLGKPEVSEWAHVSLLFLIGSWVIVIFIQRGNRAWPFLLVALIAWDLYVFDWSFQDRMAEDKKGTNFLDQLIQTRDLTEFLRLQPGLFRVHFDVGWAPNIGDMYHVQTTGGTGVTMLKNYVPFFQTPAGERLLNVRYIVSDGKDRTEPPVYTSGRWRVYENPSYCPRAWVVHRFSVNSSVEEIQRRIEEAGFDPLGMAFVDEASPLQQSGEVTEDSNATVESYQNDAMQLRVTTQSPGLLVLSEMYYPGWEATVNGKSARIYKADGILRGIAVPGGESRVEMRYRPLSVRLGAALSIAAFAGTFLFAAVLSLKKRASANA